MTKAEIVAQLADQIKISKAAATKALGVVTGCITQAMKKGDKVITIGGIYGVVTTVGEKKIALEVAPGVILDFSRSAINGFQDATKQELTENA